MRSSLFWDLTQRTVVILHPRFGIIYRPIFKGQIVQERYVFALRFKYSSQYLLEKPGRRAILALSPLSSIAFIRLRFTLFAMKASERRCEDQVK